MTKQELIEWVKREVEEWEDITHNDPASDEWDRGYLKGIKKLANDILSILECNFDDDEEDL